MRAEYGYLDDYYTRLGRLVLGGAGALHVGIDMLPKSLNHQYITRSRSVRDLHPDTKLLRDTMRERLRIASSVYEPVGKLAAVVIFFSPDWMTRTGKVRDVDIDNKVKPLLDAFELAMGIRDSRFWAIHAFKALGPIPRTELSVYDIGDAP